MACSWRCLRRYARGCFVDNIMRSRKREEVVLLWYVCMYVCSMMIEAATALEQSRSESTAYCVVACTAIRMYVDHHRMLTRIYMHMCLCVRVLCPVSCAFYFSQLLRAASTLRRVSSYSFSPCWQVNQTRYTCSGSWLIKRPSQKKVTLKKKVSSLQYSRSDLSTVQGGG